MKQCVRWGNQWLERFKKRRQVECEKTDEEIVI